MQSLNRFSTDPLTWPKLTWLFICLAPGLTCPILDGQESTDSPITGNANEFSQVNDGKGLTIRFGKQPILTYNHQVIAPPEGIDRIYARSGHVHPIYTPSGIIVTDDFSDDHAHQHGLFNAFVKANVDGKSIDFWNQHARKANVKSKSFKADGQKPDQLATVQSHYRLSDQKEIFEESWQIQTSAVENCFVIDMTINITNKTDKPVKIEKNHYGSFGLRGAGHWRDAEKSGFEFATGSGKNRQTGNLSREKWVAMQGKIGGKPCGIAVIGHPDNFRHPQPARLHPTMPYFSFAPMAIGSYDINSGETITTRFRIVAFDGKLNRKKLDALAWK